MPSLFGHAFVGVAAARLSAPPGSLKGEKALQRRLLLISLLCTVLADADVVTFALGIAYDSFWGHRGFSHSVVFSAIVGFLAASAFLKSWKFRTLKDWGWVGYFFLVSLSHPLLDAMTTGGHGVALFSPFTTHRYFFNHRTIYVSPLFVSDFFNYVGLRIVAKEIVCILLPCLAVVLLRKLLIVRLGKMADRIWVSGLAVIVLASAIITQTALVREELIPGINGVDVHKVDATVNAQKPHSVRDLPLEDVPGKRLLVNYHDLLNHHLLNTKLTPRVRPWASSSFPFWFGGASGRWQDSYFKQLWRVLLGESFTPKSDLLSVLHRTQTLGPDQKVAQAQVERFSPTEKYDLAVGDYFLSSTRFESVLHGSGSLDTFPHTPFWAGYCSWLSLAAIYESEPRRPVEVVNRDGYQIKFLPEDIKALLGISYLFITPQNWELGKRCDLDGPKSEACIDIDPAELVIALTNLIGLAKTSFLIDKEPFGEIQTAPIRTAEIKVINPPYSVNERRTFFSVATDVVKWLVDIEINLTVSKITALKNSSDEEQLTYRATLGLDSGMNLVGGRWEDPFHHPDFAWGGLSIHTQPALEGGRVLGNRLEWAVIKRLVQESSSESAPAGPVLQISQMSQDPVAHGLDFKYVEEGLSGRIAYWQATEPAQFYGYVEGKGLSQFNSIELLSLGSEAKNPSELSLAIDAFAKTAQSTKRFFKLKAPQSIENLETVVLRLNKNIPSEETLQFVVPPKKKF